MGLDLVEDDAVAGGGVACGGGRIGMDGRHDQETASGASRWIGNSGTVRGVMDTNPLRNKDGGGADAVG